MLVNISTINSFRRGNLFPNNSPTVDQYPGLYPTATKSLDFSWFSTPRAVCITS